MMTCYIIANVAGVMYTIIISSGIISVVLFHSCPATSSDYICQYVNYFGIFVALQLSINLLLFIIYSRRNNPQNWMDKAIFSTKSDCVDRKYCMDCDRMAPKRSHHCPLCKMCVLRKDHHCFMTGACVGIANQRFFIVFVFWAGVGAALGAWFLLLYLLQYVEPNAFPYSFFKFIAPFALLRWLMAYETFSNMAICITFSIACASSIAATIFFISQMFYTLKGFTMYDYHTLSRRCELVGDGESPKERLELVFGKHWFLNFIFPQLWFCNRLTPGIIRNIFTASSKEL